MREGACRTPLPGCVGLLVELLFLRENHSIDYMNHSVASQNIRLYDFSVVDFDTFLICLKLCGLTVHHLDRATFDILTHHFAGNNMVRENIGQLLLVLRLQ